MVMLQSVVITFTVLMPCYSFGQFVTTASGAGGKSSNTDGIKQKNGSNHSIRVSNTCQLLILNKNVQGTILKLTNGGAKLITHRLKFQNYTSDLLNRNVVDVYRIDRWTRVTDRQGLTLLGLPFNFGIMSLFTLTVGVHDVDIELRDAPNGCFLGLTENEKITLTKDTLMNETLVSVGLDFQRVCYQVVEAHENKARFADRCCDRPKGSYCEKYETSLWLKMLHWLLFIARIMLLLLGPLAIPKQLYSDHLKTLKYVVRLTKPVRKTVKFSSSRNIQNANIAINLKKLKGFQECRHAIDQLKQSGGFREDTIYNIEIDRYELRVNHQKLVTEEKVPVGLFYRLRRVICHCKVHYLPAFRDCCNQDALGRPLVNGSAKYSWLQVFRPVGKAVLVLMLPLPYYIRLLFYFLTEAKEVSARKDAASKRGLVLEHDHRIIGNLSPVHPIWIVIYVVYFIVSFILLHSRSFLRCFKHVRFIAFNALNSMHNVQKTKGLDLAARLCLMPVRNHGIVGVLIGVLYWPIFIPLVLLAYLIYMLPSLFLTFRILIGPGHKIMNCEWLKGNETKNKCITNLQLLYEMAWAKSPGKPENEDDDIWEKKIGKIVFHVIVRAFCLVALWAVMIAFMACGGFLIDICVYTFMGILANAGVLLRYVTIALVVVLYSHEIFKDVRDAYVKLNRSIFDEVSQRVINSDRNLEENQAFKNQEPETRDEKPDTLINDGFREDRNRPHWRVGDLVLFVDSTDMYRIPRKLFDEACGIKVAGAPGPIYMSHLRAIRELMIIICFLSFVMFMMLALGEKYNLSNTSTTLVTVVGGFLPYILRMVLKPKPPNIELSTVCFKKHLDKKISDFQQKWPLHDLPFRFVFDGEMPAQSTSYTGELAECPTEGVQLLESQDDTVTVVVDPSSPNADTCRRGPTSGGSRHGEVIELQPLGDNKNNEKRPIDILIILPK